MNDNTYNGWTNYQTWAAKLWIDNDQGSQEYWLERATDALESNDNDADAARYDLAQELESQHDEFAPEVSGVYADLLRSALGLVEWREIAASLIEDAKELTA
jgi:hypothetical protein